MAEGQPLTAFECFIEGRKGRYKENDNKFRVYGHHISELADFHPLLNYQNWVDNIEGQWQDYKSEWIPQRFRSRQQAQDFCKDFVPPKSLIEQAKVLSRELIRELIQNGGTPRILRHQAHGRFDPTSMKRVITDLHKGTFSSENTLPFKRRERLAPSRPHVGISADGSWRQFWNDSQYIPRVAALSMGVAWACEAVNCPVTAAITRRHEGGYGEYDMSATAIIMPGKKVNTSDFSVVFHPELYRMSTFFVEGCSQETLEFKYKSRTWEDIKKRRSSDVLNDCSGSGGDGVAFTKAMGATINVAIGNVNDAKDADIHLDAKTSLEEGIRKIAKMLAEQNKRMGLAA